ncbi:hypothetical protein EG329_003852 [Mollisiaceae sp. DMI_Dod_QoI]|nr:hypothetical protein EG329_003852 [Helotiales sp. DMI_Dod_QoI]
MSESAATLEINPCSSSKSPEAVHHPQAQGIAHFAVYGQPHPTSAVSSRRILSTDWETEPFIAPVTCPWNLSLTPAQISKLILGFEPVEMEDKWFVFADGPDEGGGVRVNFFRSWTGNKIFEVRVELEGLVVQGKKDGREGRIKELVYESNEEVVAEQDEEGAKEMVAELCKWVLGIELEGEE